MPFLSLVNMKSLCLENFQTFCQIMEAQTKQLSNILHPFSTEGRVATNLENMETWKTQGI